MTAAPETSQAWRCTVCSKLSNAARRPRRHFNSQTMDFCGPFEAATVAPDGAVLVAPDLQVSPTVSKALEMDPLYRHRVTALREFVAGCPRATILGSKHTTGGIDTAGDRGSLMHAAIAETLRTLWLANEPQMGQEDVVAILRETHAHGPWVVTPADMFGVRKLDGTPAHRGILQMMLSFAEETWTPSRFAVIEGARPELIDNRLRFPPAGGRMTVDIVCPDSEVRTLSGAPDFIILAPPSSAVIIDHKQSMKRPVEPREPVPDGEAIQGVQYMTDPAGDYFQLVSYGCLAMHMFPSIQTVTLREKSWRWLGNPREATIRRDDLEHILPYLGTVMMQHDQALRGERPELALPRAGSTCQTRCSVKRSCPIPEEERGVGAIHDEASADAEAKRWYVSKARDPEFRAAIKGFHEQTGYCPKVSDEIVARWKSKADAKGRDFGFFEPVIANDATSAAADTGLDEDYLAPWLASLEAQQETGAAT